MTKGRPPTPKAPQEKKALSLAKDRRNAYSANDKASRKLIPLSKARESREARHAADQALRQAVALDEAAVDLVESSVRQDVFRVGGWRKDSDAPLAEHLERQAARGDRRIGRKTRNEPPKA